MKEGYLIALMWALSVGSCLCLAAEGTDPSGLSQLKLELKVELDDVLPRAPLAFTVSLSNPTEKPVPVATSLTPGAGFVTVFVAEEGGTFRAFDSADWPLASVIVKTRILRPGTVSTVHDILYHGWVKTKEGVREHRCVVPEPGTYRLKAVLVDKAGNSIESNIVEVKVGRPVGLDGKALDFLVSLDKRDEPELFQGFLMRTCGRTLSAGEQKLVKEQEDFLKQFGATRYAPYVAYSLGWTLTTAGGESYARGVAFLEQAAMSKHSYLAGKALFHLVELCIKRGDLDAGKQYLANLRKKHPDSEETKAAAALLDRATSTTAPSGE